MAIKTQYVVYNAKNFSTGLTDVTANITKDGGSTPVATGLALAEINSTDMPGRYRLTLTPTQINSFGGVGTYIVKINSASKSAEATAKLVIQANDLDDISASITALDGRITVIEGKIDGLVTDLASVKTTVESSNTLLDSGPNSLAVIKALVDTVQSGVSGITQATRTVVAFPTELVSPATGSRVYEVLINIYNGESALEDPDTNLVNVSLKNSGGLDRGNLFQGGGSSPKAATRISTGRYKVLLEIPAGTTKEQINMLVNYTENTEPMEAIRSANVVSSVDATGLAQQATLQEVLDDTSVIQPQVADIQSVVNDAVFGLEALKNALNAIDTLAQGNNDVLTSATIGNQAIIDAIAATASQTSVDNIVGDLTSIKGAGFDTGVDSLKQISDRQFTGGYAV